MVLSITDVTILDGEGIAAPAGWELCPVDLNEGAGGSWLYLAFRRDPEKQSTPITDLAIQTDGSAVPEGWSSLEVDLNKGTRRTGSVLHLLYERAGAGKPIVGLSVVRDRTRVPRGYEMLPTDLNQGARGSDLFLVVLRRQRTITISRIACVVPSLGYDDSSKFLVTTAVQAAIEAATALATKGGSVQHAAASAAKVAARTAAEAVAKEAATRAATAGARALGVDDATTQAGLELASGTTAVHGAVQSIGSGPLVGVDFTDSGSLAELTEAGVAKVVDRLGPTTPDNVYLRLHGEKVWPATTSGVQDMRSDDIVTVGVVLPFDGDTELKIVDKDYPLWVLQTESFSHDVLAERTFAVADAVSGIYQLGSEAEKCLYLVEVFIDLADGSDASGGGLDIEAHLTSAKAPAAP